MQRSEQIIEFDSYRQIIATSTKHDSDVFLFWCGCYLQLLFVLPNQTIDTLVHFPFAQAARAEEVIPVGGIAGSDETTIYGTTY